MLTKLPKEMYAEIARFLGDYFPGNGFRLAAGNVQIKDIVDGRTYLNGLLHSFDDQPIVTYDDRRTWYQHGKKHRDNDQPAEIYGNGNKYWYKHNQIHRDNDRPAIVANGNQYWYQHNLLHRENDQPAIIFANRTRSWYTNGRLHRDNGPAIIFANGHVTYWSRGRHVK